jgi:protein EFR3
MFRVLPSTPSTLDVVYRTRLVGLAVINGVVTSEALYSSSTFKDQVATLVPAILSNLQEIELSVLEDELV